MNIIEIIEKASWWLWIHGVAHHFVTSLGLIPDWVTPVRVIQDLELGPKPLAMMWLTNTYTTTLSGYSCDAFDFLRHFLHRAFMQRQVRQSPGTSDLYTCKYAAHQVTYATRFTISVSELGTERKMIFQIDRIRAFQWVPQNTEVRYPALTVTHMVYFAHQCIFRLCYLLY